MNSRAFQSYTTLVAIQILHVVLMNHEVAINTRMWPNVLD